MINSTTNVSCGQDIMGNLRDLPEAGQLTVLYDGDCPLCRREIGWYRGLNGAERVRWVNLRTIPGEMIIPGISHDAAIRRFHIISADGSVKIGGSAFLEIWRKIPCLRPLAFIFRPRACAWLLDQVYDLFLRFRPGLQRLLTPRGR